MNNTAAELLKWIPEQHTNPNARSMVYRMIERGVPADTISLHVQRFGLDEAYFLLMGQYSAKRRRSWWRHLMR